MAIQGAIAVVVSYFLGATPTAYIITRWLTGKDIRQMGGGNMGGHNVYVEVGHAAGIAVGAIDIAKGVVAVAVAQYLLEVDEYFILGAGMAAVLGHLWPIYLKFKGGNGLATAVGVLAMTQSLELAIAVVLALIIIFFIRDIILSVNISLVTVPISTWFLERSWLHFGFVTFLLLVLLIHFIPRIGKRVTEDRE